MTSRRTMSSTPRLSDLARHVVVPSGAVSTGWPAVRDKARDLGITFDPWQDGAGRVILAKRADGKYAATIGGTALSIPRQVGKTFLVGAIVFALCLLNPGMTVIWTAHRLRTAGETFDKMQGMTRRRRISPHIDRVVLGSGEEEVRFKNGSRILFGARERGFGRGFDQVDVLIFDEAQILTENAIDDMVPATNQSQQPTGALMLFIGTPPKPTDPGEVFTRMRADALSGEDEDTGYVEFSADPGFEPTAPPVDMKAEDWAQIAKANPSFPHRTPREAILRMRKKLTHESMRREGFGAWDEGETLNAAVPLDAWRSRVVTSQDVSPDWPLAAVGLDMDLSGRVWVSVAAHGDGPAVHGELLPDDPLTEGGVDAAVRWLWERCRKRLPVVMPADSGATMLEAPLLAKGMKVYRLNLPEQAQASSGLVQALRDGEVSHLDDPVLEQTVREVQRVEMKSGLWRIGREGELSGAPLLAFACARFGAVKWSKRRGGTTSHESARSGRSSSGRASTSREAVRA